MIIKLLINNRLFAIAFYQSYRAVCFTRRVSRMKYGVLNMVNGLKVPISEACLFDYMTPALIVIQHIKSRVVCIWNALVNVKMSKTMDVLQMTIICYV